MFAIATEPFGICFLGVESLGSAILSSTLAKYAKPGKKPIAKTSYNYCECILIISSTLKFVFIPISSKSKPTSLP